MAAPITDYNYMFVDHIKNIVISKKCLNIIKEKSSKIITIISSKKWKAREEREKSILKYIIFEGIINKIKITENWNKG